MHFHLLSIILGILIFGSHASASNSTSEVISAEEIDWGYLNPLRGKLSPGAADLWGSRTQNTASGMLVRFNKGFSSPPHIHNITYRGVVIEGQLHNDDPNAEKMWMPSGSFWTQPAGEEHITAADGETNMIYLEIDSGPYLVKPSKQKFDSGEYPLNLHRSNIVWLDQTDNHKITADGVKIVSLWGSASSDELGGYMLKLPADYRGEITTESPEFRAVVIQGSLFYQSDDFKEKKSLKAGSYFGSKGLFTHKITSPTQSETILYVRSNQHFKLK